MKSEKQCDVHKLVSLAVSLYFPVGKLTSFRHLNDNGPDVNKLSFFIWFESSNDIIFTTSKWHDYHDIKKTFIFKISKWHPFWELTSYIIWCNYIFMISKPEVIYSFKSTQNYIHTFDNGFITIWKLPKLHIQKNYITNEENYYIVNLLDWYILICLMRDVFTFIIQHFVWFMGLIVWIFDEIMWKRISQSMGTSEYNNCNL